MPCSLTASPFLLLIPSLLEGQHYSRSKTDSHRQQKETLISVQGWATLFTFDIAAGQSLLPSQSHSGICLFTDRESYSMLVCSESFRVSCFSSRGSWYLYMTFLFSPFIKWLCKPAYIKTLNSVNLKSLSTFSMVEGCSWMLYVTRGFSDKIIFHPAHLFLMCRVGGVLNTWIFMNVRKAYMYHSDFHPCHQAMQITSSHLHTTIQSPLSPLINDAEKMFFLPRKISSFKCRY